MKVQLIILVTLLYLSNCKGQVKSDSIIKRETAIETFDINKYRDWDIDTKYSPSKDDKYLKYSNEGVKILYFNDTFQEEKNLYGNPILDVKSYYVKTNSLKLKGQTFYNLEFGIWKEYDEKGNLIKETNYDKEYKFSIDDLVKKMKEKYNYDLMNMEKTYNLNRYIDLEKTKLPLYEVYYRDDKNTQVLHSYVINGNTGEILFSTLRSTQGKQGSLYDAFIKVERSKIK
ncbi:hypothetical protein OIU83_04600 [Flavobacterium sp. LS1R49]|uniref:MORN repeat variant n=1 Tax=Flavobacterium shii TaxID=2987687 RepID=A0A9X2ZAU9_9FLAO|nr:hypothetical protein [Flavobacterium shii]MCV9926915.1 hypothetical protein [Flavobacterium shii]